MKVLPAAALVAIVLFIAKEAVEFYRRWRADERKLHAIKMLLARECEFNHWTYKRLRDIVTTIKDEMEKDCDTDFRVLFSRSGKAHFRVMMPDGEEGGGLLIVEVHREVINDQLIEVAALDKCLYATVEKAHSALTDFEHIRDGIIYYIEEDRRHLDGFVDYATRELDDAFKDLAALYVACTGKPLEQHRLR